MLTHDNVVASIETFHRIVPPMEHRLVSLLPLSHLLEQAVGLFYALDVGADILYVRSRNPRVIFDALRDHRVTSMVVVPQVLDLFWSAIEREVAKRGRTSTVRAAARHRPAPALPGPALRCSGSVHAAARRPLPAVPLIGRLPAAGAAAGLGRPRRHRPAGLRRDRDRHRGVHDARRPRAGHRRPRRRPASRCASPQTARSSSAAGPSSPAIGTPPSSRPQAFTEDGWYRTGDLGPVRRRRAPHPERPDQGHHRPAEWLQRVSRGHRERPPDRRAARRGGRRDRAGADRDGRARARQGGAAPRPRPVSRRRSRPRTRRSGPTSGSPVGASGRSRTSREPTRSRSSATRSAGGPRPTRRCRSARKRRPSRPSRSATGRARRCRASRAPPGCRAGVGRRSRSGPTCT